jgi:hypothetical protein
MASQRRVDPQELDVDPVAEDEPVDPTDNGTLRVAEEDPDCLPKPDRSAVLEDVLAQPQVDRCELRLALLLERRGSQAHS